MGRYAIYGAGSLGTILGAYITKNGGEVDLINRNAAHVEALREKGARIIGTELVGLTPGKALLDCAEFYLKLENFNYRTQVMEYNLL